MPCWFSAARTIVLCSLDWLFVLGRANSQNSPLSCSTHKCASHPPLIEFNFRYSRISDYKFNTISNYRMWCVLALGWEGGRGHKSSYILWKAILIHIACHILNFSVSIKRIYFAGKAHDHSCFGWLAVVAVWNLQFNYKWIHLISYSYISQNMIHGFLDIATFHSLWIGPALLQTFRSTGPKVQI